MADLLVVIRSGATDYDLQGRISGNLDIPLTPAGIAAASETARHLAAAPPVALYTSPTTCAIETADVIGDRLHLVPRRVPHLVGLDLGLWQGMLVSEIRRRQPRLARHWEEDPWTVVPPDGEPLSAARDRIAQAIGKIGIGSRNPFGETGQVTGGGARLAGKPRGGSAFNCAVKCDR